MQSPQVLKQHSRQKSQSKASWLSASTSPVEAPLRRSSTVAFVQVDAGPTGVSNEARRAVRVQAARSSAAARKQTIARKLALMRAATFDEPKDPNHASDPIRRLSLPTVLACANNPATTPSSASESSSPTLSVKQAEPVTHGFPTLLQNPELPTIVDYFLTYFAPSSEGPTDLRGRENVRKQIWTQALQCPALFHACLLVAGSHAYATQARHVPMTLLSQAKHIAIASINMAVMQSVPNEQVEESVILAITLLGGWELEYGEQSIYSTHMRGLQTIIQLRGGLTLTDVGREGGAKVHGSGNHSNDNYDASPPMAKSLSDAAIGVILSVGFNHSLYAGLEPYFDNPNAYIPKIFDFIPQSLPEGLQELRQQQLFHGTLLNMICMLHSLHPTDPSMTANLSQIGHALAEWEVWRSNAVLFSPLQTDLEDRMNGAAHRLVRLAGLALCDCVRPIFAPEPTAWPQSLYADTLKLRPEMLVGTVYDGVAFWALFVICAVTARCETRHTRVLRRMRRDLNISTWDALKTWLNRYAYPATVLDGRAYPLWEAIATDNPASTKTATDPNGSDDDDGDTTFKLLEPTRYAKGIPHPTLQIGKAISANEMQQWIEVPALNMLR